MKINSDYSDSLIKDDGTFTTPLDRHFTELTYICLIAPKAVFNNFVFKLSIIKGAESLEYVPAGIIYEQKADIIPIEEFYPAYEKTPKPVTELEDILYNPGPLTYHGIAVATFDIACSAKKPIGNNDFRCRCCDLCKRHKTLKSLIEELRKSLSTS